jgi:acyl-CoA synthetase (NDP forming)
MFVSVGNRTDVSGNDLLEYWAHDEHVRLVLAYLESFGDPRRFKSVARAFTRRKPIIMVKAGRTEAGARAASSHTGSIVEKDAATESLFEQSGVLRVPNIHGLFLLATAFAHQEPPMGRRLAIVTNAGGPGILATDAASATGLTMATLTEGTRRRLREVLRAEASVANPVDIIATATPHQFGEALRILDRDPGVDGTVGIFVSPILVDVREVGSEILKARTRMKKPLLTCLMGRQRNQEAVEELLRSGLPVYQYPETAVQAFAGLVRYREIASEPEGEVIEHAVKTDVARRILQRARKDARRLLLPDEATRLLEAYGFPVVEGREVGTSAEAIAFAHEVGYPVVVKVAGEEFIHKTDVGGIRLDLRNGDEVAEACQEMKDRLFSPRKRAKARFLIQKMIRGREVILGSTADERFGPLLLFGLGGIHVEVLRDVSVRTHPLTDQDSHDMIRAIRGYPLLESYRGSDPVDVGLLEEMLQRLSQLAGDHPEISEIDLNPFIIGPKGKPSGVVDARILLG